YLEETRNPCQFPMLRHAGASMRFWVNLPIYIDTTSG
ncbi:MAG: hypothetical protein QOD67_2559, partial [Caballeronia sp.]|nr:hypothetical protein [Caballeronia sp.]